MALSGNFNKYGYGGYSNLGLYVTWSAEQSVADNYSDVTAKVYMRSWNTSHSASNLTITAFGVSKTITANAVNDSNSSWDNHYLGSATLRVNHDSAGNKSGTISVSWAFNGYIDSTYVTNMSATSETITLNQIPRKATIITAPNFTDEENPAITYNNPLGTNAKLLQACISLDGKTELITYRDIDMSATSYTFAFTDEERLILLTAARSTNSLTVYFVVKTKIGETDYTSTSKKTMTVINANPIFTNASYESINHLNLANSSTVIKGYSNIRITMSEATPLKQAEIIEYKVIVGSKVNENVGLIHTIENVDDSIIRCFAIDSRGNVTEKIVNISNYIDYSPVTLDVYESSRIGNISSDVLLELGGLAWNGNFGLVDNALSIQYFYKVRGSEIYTQGSTEISIDIASNYSVEMQIAGDLGTNGFDVDKNYDIKVVVSDKLSSTEKSMILRKGRPGISVHEKGVAFGNFYDKTVGGVLQGYSEELDKMIDLINLNRYYPVGHIYISVNETNPSSLFGGTWEQIKDTFLLSAGDTYKAGETGGEAKHTLTVEEMPSHKHAYPFTNSLLGVGASSANKETNSLTGNGGSWSNIRASGNTMQNTGGSEAHNNMPPYLVVYMWKRVS